MSSYCPICNELFQADDRCQYNIPQTFIWKPANVPDEPMTIERNGRTVNVNPAAVLSSHELAERRKAYTKTAIATTFFTYGKAEVPKEAMNVRHVSCVVAHTGTRPSSVHPANKHMIRHQRPMVKK